MDGFKDDVAPHPLIFLLEDDHCARRSMHLLLQGQGIDVRAHGDALSLLADTEIISAACLVSNHNPDSLDAISVLRTLRRQGWQGPALLITASTTTDLVSQAMAAGFQEVLRKPISDHMLIKTLDRMIVRR